MYDPLFDIKGRVIVLTGACGLIGKRLAASFNERGAKLVLVDVAHTPPDSLAEGSNSNVIQLTCDVSRAEEVAGLTETVLDRFKRVDVLVNSHQYKPSGFTSAQAETFPE